MKLIDRYIIRELIAPFFISVSLIMLLFTLNLAFRMLGRIVGQGLPPMVILEFFFLNLAWILTLAVPMSVLVASLMAFGRLAGDFEIVALKAAGISLIRMIIPAIAASIVVGAFSLYFQDKILPDYNHRNKLLTISIRRKKPSIAIKDGIFTRDLPKQTLLVGSQDPSKDMLHSITIFDDSDQKKPSTVVADSGRLSFVDSLGMYQFRLFSGEIHQLERTDPSGYEILSFEEAIFRFNAENQLLKRRESGYRGDRELGLGDLKKRIDDLKNRKDVVRHQKQINRYKVEYHKKYAISFAVIVFVLIGAPLGVKLHKGGLGISAGMSIFFFLLYWTFLIGGEDIADRGLVDPWIAMWAPNMLLFIFGFILIRLEMQQHLVINFGWRRKNEYDARDTEDWKISPDRIEEYARIESEKYSGSVVRGSQDSRDQLSKRNDNVDISVNDNEVTGNDDDH
ncbi:MAG: LptF/LptG family permease [Candidatus Electryonea clarkiae]|nr:LptF/LptG family permease [Candidatus Electryonea clarkiae]MDP8285904.1 LptF/LptG family permease [Candidatus Electryonea clarkiae]